MISSYPIKSDGSLDSQSVNQKIINILLNRESNLDFIAYIISPFHALGVDAYVYDLYKLSERKLEGIIVINEHIKSGFVSHEDTFKCTNFANVEFIYAKKSLCLKNNTFQLLSKINETIRGTLNITINKYLSNNKKEIAIITPMNISIIPFRYFSYFDIADKYNPKFIVIDEGLGTYMGKDVWRLVSLYDSNKCHISNNQKIFQIIFSKFLNKIIYFLKYTSNVEYKTIFLKSNHKLLPNISTIASYKAILSVRNNDLPNEVEAILRIKKWVIFASQPFVEYGQINPDDYLQILEQIIDTLSKKNYYVLLKPHPREDMSFFESTKDKYNNIFLLSNSIALEKIFNLNPCATIGLTSTALVTSNLFYDIPSISIIEILLNYTNDSLMLVTKKQFKQKFKTWVNFVDSIEEFDRTIK